MTLSLKPKPKIIWCIDVGTRKAPSRSQAELNPQAPTQFNGVPGEKAE